MINVNNRHLLFSLVMGNSSLGDDMCAPLYRGAVREDRGHSCYVFIAGEANKAGRNVRFTSEAHCLYD